MNLEEIRMRCRQADLPLKKTATQIVFGKGNPKAPIMFLGEAPGKQEDIQGIPFVGRAGKELDTLLNSIGLTLDDCYIANILKYRPPGNRDPTPDEIAAHTPYLVEQIHSIKPTVIATLGNFSTKFVLAGCDVEKMKSIPGVSALHGRPRAVRIDGNEVTVIPLYHPAAMLYRPQLRDVMKKDFLSMGEFLVHALKEKAATIKQALVRSQRDVQQTLEE